MAWQSRARARRSIARAGALALVLGFLLAGSQAGSALAAPARYQGSLDSIVRYLQGAQNPDGGFASEAGEASNPDTSAWVALALAAAGINPRDQTPAGQHYIGGHSVYAYLSQHPGELSESTAIERDLLVVDAAGTSASDFGGVNLLERILLRQLSRPSAGAGAFVHEAGSSEAAMNDTVFAILALSPIHQARLQAAVRAAAEWVEAEQDCDGGWPATAYRTGGACPPGGGSLPGEPESDVDMTGAAIEALDAAGREGAAAAAEGRAFEFLERAQKPDGGFSQEPDVPGKPQEEANVASTAWVVQAMWSAGIEPESWVTGSGLASEEPLGYMASLLQADGHVRYEQSHEENGVWVTAYVGAAMAGDAYPIPEAPYEELPPAPAEASSPASSATALGAGPDGESSKAGGGVDAGGGGDGAPLFSRPQPASKGHTPGGARVLTRGRARVARKPAPARSAHKSSTIEDASERPPVPAADRKPPALVTGANGGSHAAIGPASAGNARGGGGAGAGGRVVKGLLIGDTHDVPEPGAPGLRGAGAGAGHSPWLAVAIAALIAVLILAGSQLERRRPQVIL